MECKIDLSKEYGIVLEGGGARGAYQIGAWKALREAGVRIKGIAGASVGALNGAMMCTDDFEKAEELWENISYSQVIDMDDAQAKAMLKMDFNSINIGDFLKKFIKVLTDGGFDVSPLRKLIEENVDEDRIRNSGRELFATVFSLDDRKEETVDLKNVPSGEICDMLLASAYFIAFKREKLGGRSYMDGGGFNNVPVNVLTEHGYKDIIAIRIYGLGYDTTRSLKVPPDVNIFYIAPRQDLGGILEFDRKRCRYNMKLGYFDAERFLFGLSGRRYYIDAPEEEEYYLTKLETEAAKLKVSRFGIYTIDTFREAILEKYKEMLLRKKPDTDEEEET